VLRACHIIARWSEPWCEELFVLPIALHVASLGVLGGPLGLFAGAFGLSWGSLGLSWGPFWLSWGLLEAFGRLGALLAASWDPLGSFLGLSWGSLGAVLGPSRAVAGPS